MKKQIMLSMALVLIAINAHATFSVVAVDPLTGQVGSAGATCISGANGAIVISDVLIGVGVVHTQSYYLPSNQNNASNRMMLGDSPAEIMTWLEQNDVQNDPSIRQYIAADLNGGVTRGAGFTGAACGLENLDVSGPGYAMAGNILISEDVVTDMQSAFENTPGSLADRLMATMQAANRIGADSRCESFDISSASAFLRVASPCDTDNSLGALALDLEIYLDGSGVFEPIELLQTAYDNAPAIPDCVYDSIFKFGFESF